MFPCIFSLHCVFFAALCVINYDDDDDYLTHWPPLTRYLVIYFIMSHATDKLIRHILYGFCGSYWTTGVAVSQLLVYRKC